MESKTLHKISEWEEITSVEPSSNANEDFNARFRPYIRAAKAKSRQGILLEIIQSDAPFDIVRSAIYLYRGFNRGFRIIEQMVERENKRFIEIDPLDSENPNGWRWSIETHLSELIELFGWMQTDRSHAYLMRLAQPPYHPQVQLEAIDAMAFEGDKFDPKFILDLLLDSKTPDGKICNALYCMMYNNSHYKSSKVYVEAIWPFVTHPSPSISREAISALAQKAAGRKKLQEVVAHHRSEFPYDIARNMKEELSCWPTK